MSGERQTQERGGDTPLALGWLACALIVFLAVALRVLAYAPFDISHADEWMQYLEQANRLVTGHGIVPWESRVGLRSAMIPQLLSLPVLIAHAIAPATLAHVHLARAAFAALTLMGLAGAWRLGSLTSRRHALAALFVAAVWWESVLYADLLLSESLSTALLLLAATPLLDPKAGSRASTFAGFLIGMGVIVRVQYAPFAAVLCLGALLRSPRAWQSLGIGGLAAALLGVASDLYAGRVPFAWVAVTFDKNLGEGIAARFSTSPPWQYLLDMLQHFGPGALLMVVLGAAASGRRYRPLLWAAIVNLTLHSLIAHKEYRFIWLTVLTLLVLAAIGSLRLIEHLLQRRGNTQWLGWGSLGAALVLWSVLDLSSYRVSGGLGAYRGGSAITRLAIVAAERPEVCRLALAKPYLAHVVPAVLPRDLPLSVAPAGFYEDRIALPAPLEHAANALLTARRPEGMASYRTLRCMPMPGETACLYVRDGGCTGDPTYSYQQTLERDGL
ncbi:hypothetical protein HNO88_000646 [Novosphingobium chloroacetimidivorans]|uniref:Alg9-like mannosyltransferase family protein n=1 Tax=Novosphingobium chloroacetimidivorans TaxID=1428314 RepID=A0A7W7K6U7_9SPHN|nr:hypothetical protein [Novosphingobium chloroacetimidivorans]MBB4857339.1 hypothetical protein [Novosphingobium chloroacetimidivorans]